MVDTGPEEVKYCTVQGASPRDPGSQSIDTCEKAAQVELPSYRRKAFEAPPHTPCTF